MTAAEDLAPHLGDAGSISARTLRTVQLQLSAVTLVTVAVVASVQGVTNTTPLIIGLATATVATVLALLLPWDQLPRYAAAVIPTIDLIAIWLLRESSPSAGFTLLWAFPVMWSAWSFGLVGAVASGGVVSVAYVLLTVPGAGGSPFVVMFPATMVLLAAITHVVARRVRAQRALLERQTLALRRSTARAHRQEGLITDVLDSVDFGVAAFAPDGSILITNEAHARLQRIIDNAGDAVYAADGFSAITPSERAPERARKGGTFEAELVWYGSPGSPDRRALQLTARQLRGPFDEVVGRVIVARDVTDEQLALRARDDLVASVSHELRTPLTSIVGYLDLVEDAGELAETTRHNVQVAQRNAERLLVLVTDVLAISATSRMGLDLRVDPEPVDLAGLMHAAVEDAQVRATERGMTIDATAVEPCPALADAPRIRQVVDNLIGNAIKYGHQGGRIEVGSTTDGHRSWLVVRDDGPGIAPHDQAHLFDRFYRAQSVRHTATHGSGLGLAISRDIVRAHSGEITVTSNPGEGATFVVRLPATDPEESA